MKRSEVWTTRVPGASVERKKTTWRAKGPSVIVASSLEIRPGSSPMSMVSVVDRAAAGCSPANVAVTVMTKTADKAIMRGPAPLTRPKSLMRVPFCAPASRGASHIDEGAIAVVGVLIHESHPHFPLADRQNLAILHMSGRRFQTKVGLAVRAALWAQL